MTRAGVDQQGADYHALGRACLLLGRLDEAWRLANLAVGSSPAHPGFAAHAQQLLGDVATHPDRFDAENGELHYRGALALAESRGMRPLVAQALPPHGQARAGPGDLATGTTMYREMGMTYWLEKAEAEMAEG